MNGLESPHDYLRRLEAFRLADQERHDVTVGLVEKYSTLLSRFDQLRNDYNDAVESRRMWQNKASQREKVLDELQRAVESNQFVFVAIDGDGAYFRDELIAKGEEGGEEAAHKLLANVKQHLKTFYPKSNVDDWSIIAMVALNLSGLSKALYARGIVKGLSDELPAFARAFGRTQHLFSFVDVGEGKERADHKIREMTRVMVRVGQCKHLYFGPCNDAGYLPFLGTYKGDLAIAPKVTLIETSPALPGFCALGFSRVNFNDVFRSSPLPDKLPFPARTLVPSAEITLVATAPPGLSGSPVGENGFPPPSSNSWAVLSKNGAAAKTINISAKKPPAPKYYVVNSNGERLDEELPRWDSAAEKRFAARLRENGNLCNFYHLRATCPDPAYCGYAHGDRLTAGEVLVLRHKARSLLCSTGSDCKDPECFYGHHCRYGRSCNNTNCRFVPTHYVQIAPAARIYDDGTEEKIL